MKKLMIVLAAVAMAGATQAAAILWSTGKVTLPGTTTNMSGSNTALYFWSETISDPWTSKATATGEGDAAVYSVAATDASKVQYKTGSATITGNTSTYSSGDTAYGTVIVTYDSNGDGKIGVGDYYMTGTGSYTLEADANKTVGLTMASWTQITASSSGGTTPVPEPTSGLLLLVGGAMIALRRKQK